MAEILHADGRVELDDQSTTEIESSALYNHDLAPVRVAKRTWSTYNFAALWVSMAHCIPTYTLASDFIARGMSWKQALFTIALGNVIVLAPILANSHPGTKYGIPFPVFARAAYGTVGANLPALLRALVACGWFGINTWIGGKALNTFFVALWPAWKTLGGQAGGYPMGLWIAFAIFWGINILIVYRGMDLLRHVENWAAPFVLVMTALLVWWAIDKAHGLGTIINAPQAAGDFGKLFVPSLTATIGFWATLSLNMPDFTRFGRSQKEQMVGQVVALPTTMTVFAAMAVLITSASAVIYGSAVSDPIELVGKFTQTWIVAIAMFTVVVATLAVNIAANVVSPANDFANAFPRFIDFKRGGLITGIIGVMMMPWKLADDPTGYIYRWLLGYSGGLGAIAGVLIADYYVVRRRELRLADLYRRDGAYRYTGGWNVPATVATLIGCAVAWAGAFIPAFARLYDYAWFVGFGLASSIYLALMKRR
jgi:NCS1 family nucleobase:cation symporter-1